MKKTIIRLLGLTLSLILAVSSVVCVSACPRGNVKHYDVYTCLGDSNAAGFGTSGYVYSPLPSSTAYHSLVADAVGAELRQYALGATRTEDILYLIDPDYDMDWSFSMHSSGSDSHKEHLDSVKKAYNQAIIDADLITLQIGANDLSEKVGPYMAVMSAPIPSIEALKEKISNSGFANETLLTVIGLVDQVAKLFNTAVALYKYGKEATAEYGSNFDRVVKNIYRLNPDVDLVVLSVTNPLHNVYLSESLQIDIGNIYALTTRQLNNWIKYKSEYRNDYTYCDITDIQYPGGSIGNLLQDTELTFYVIHMLDDGHAQVADRIISVLPKE